MKPQIQAALQQAIINQLMPELCSFKPTMTFKGIKPNGIIHNALTAHGASTHTAWDSMGYPILNQVDVIPIAMIPPAWQCMEYLDIADSVPHSLQPQTH